MATAIETKQDELRQNLSNLKDDLNNILNHATAESRELTSRRDGSGGGAPVRL